MNFEKTSQLLSKLKSPVLEVQARTLNTLFTKLQTQVLSPQQLLTSHFQVVGDLLGWINDNQTNGLIEKVLMILMSFAEAEKGREIMIQYGTVEFLQEFKPKVEKDQKKLDIIEKTLYLLVKDQQADEPKENRDFSNTNINKNLEGKMNPITESSKLLEFSITDNSNKLQTINSNKNDKIIEFSSLKAQITEEIQKLSEKNLEITKKSMKTFETELIYLQNSLISEDFPYFSEEMPVLHEADEKYLFETTVKLKFSDVSVIKSLLRNEIPNILGNFPVELFKFQSDLINELLNLLNKMRSDNEEKLMESLVIDCLVIFIRRIRKNIEKSNKNQEKQEKRQNFTENIPKNNENLVKMTKTNEKKTFYTSQASIFQLLHRIISTSIKLFIRFPELSDQSFSVLNIELLSLLKTLQNPLVFSTEILKIYNAAATLLDLDLYLPKYLIFLLFFREIFCLNPPNAITESFLPPLEKSFIFLYNCCLKHIFTSEKSEEVLIFAYLFQTPNHNLEKLRRLSSSRQTLSIYLDLARFSPKLLIKDHIELESTIEKLCQSLPAIGLFEGTRVPSRIYLEIFLYTMTNINENPENYEKTRDFLVKICYSPINSSFFSVLLEKFDENSPFFNGYLYKDLIFEALLDPSLSLHVLSQALKTEETLEIGLELLKKIITRTFREKPREIKRINEILSFYWIIQGKKHRKSSEILEFINENAVFLSEEAEIMSLFSRNESSRRKLSGYLGFKGDYLSEFMNSSKNTITYKEIQIGKGINMNNVDFTGNIEKLLKISSNPSLDIRVRAAAVEQILESLENIRDSHEILSQIKVFVLEIMEKWDKNNEIGDEYPIFAAKIVTLGNKLAENNSFVEIRGLRQNIIRLMKAYERNGGGMEIRFQLVKMIQLSVLVENLTFLAHFDVDCRDLIEAFNAEYYILPETKRFLLKNKRNEAEFWQEFYPLCDNFNDYLQKTEGNNIENEKSYLMQQIGQNNSFFLAFFFPDNPEMLKIDSNEILSGQGFGDEEKEELRLVKIRRFGDIARKVRRLNDENNRELEKIVAFLNKRMVGLFMETNNNSIAINNLKKSLFFQFLYTISRIMGIKKNGGANKILSSFIPKALEILNKSPSALEFRLLCEVLGKMEKNMVYSLQHDIFELLLAFPADGQLRNLQPKRQTLELLNRTIDRRIGEGKPAILSFLMKIYRYCDPEMRLLAWNLAYKFSDLTVLSQFRSILDDLIANFIEFKENEEILAFSIFFLGEILSFSNENQENHDNFEENSLEKNEFLLEKNTILHIFSEKSVISHIDFLFRSSWSSLSNILKSCLFGFLRKILENDFKNAMATISSLELIEFIIERLSEEISNENLVKINENKPKTTNFGYIFNKKSINFNEDLNEKNPIPAQFAHFIRIINENDRDFAHYLMKSTEILAFLWSELFKKPLNFDILADILTDFLEIDEDLTIFSLSKSQNSNNFLIFFLSNPELLENNQQILNLLEVLLKKHTKSSVFLNDFIENSKENIAERLISELYRAYQSLETDKTLALGCVAGVLVLNTKAKLVFSKSGFILDILKELGKICDSLLVSSTRKKPNIAKVNSLMTPMILTLRAFFFLQASQDQTEELLNEETLEFERKINDFSEPFNKLLKLALISEEFMPEFSKMLINLLKNPAFSHIFLQKSCLSPTELLPSLSRETTSSSNSWILKILGAGIENTEVRGLLIKSKSIESLANKVSQVWIRGKDQASQFIRDSLEFLSVTSFYKEFRPKILSNTELFETYLDLLKLSNMTSLYTLPTLQILTNTALHQELKPLLTGNTRLLAMIVTLLLSDKHPLELRALASQFIVNLIYKSNKGIAGFRRPEVLEEIGFLVKETERLIDREKENGGDGERLELWGIVMENGRRVLNVASVEWHD